MTLSLDYVAEGRQVTIRAAAPKMSYDVLTECPGEDGQVRCNYCTNNGSHFIKVLIAT